MHEAAAIQGAVSVALERVAALGSPRVRAVELALGVSGHITDAIARQQFAICALGTPLETAALRIVWLPATYQCFTCLRQFSSVEPAEGVACPECGGVALEIAHDDACYIQAIDVDGAGGVDGEPLLADAPRAGS
ncbi:MAG TPA: hydrogenase maturation nickel metallochaperone HypA [Ktedonobacterales bacterium]